MAKAEAALASVLDASALMAHLHSEPGAQVVGDCVEVGRLRPVTVPQGLSLADRACLALAARLGVPALTTDRSWADADVEAEVVLIR